MISMGYQSKLSSAIGRWSSQNPWVSLAPRSPYWPYKAHFQELWSLCLSMKKTARPSAYKFRLKVGGKKMFWTVFLSKDPTNTAPKQNRFLRVEAMKYPGPRREHFSEMPRLQELRGKPHPPPPYTPRILPNLLNMYKLCYGSTMFYKLCYV
jgi:hypothetical protein